MKKPMQLCSISGLPIYENDPCAAILVAEQKIKPNLITAPDVLWQPFFPPIYGIYNGQNSLKEIQGETWILNDLNAIFPDYTINNLTNLLKSVSNPDFCFSYKHIATVRVCFVHKSILNTMMQYTEEHQPLKDILYHTQELLTNLVSKAYLCKTDISPNMPNNQKNPLMDLMNLLTEFFPCELLYRFLYSQLDHPLRLKCKVQELYTLRNMMYQIGGVWLPKQMPYKYFSESAYDKLHQSIQIHIKNKQI